MLNRTQALFIALWISLPFMVTKPNDQNTQDPRLSAIKNCLFASTLGDGLGRVTEFISTLDAMFKRYPKGVRSIKDFHFDDWQGVPKELRSAKALPYTDDTRMALVVCQTLIKSSKQHLDLEPTMGNIAQAFIEDFNNQKYGWAAPFRAPGMACLKGVKTLKALPSGKRTTGWWNTHADQAGGCGSVMRAFPFGLVFAHDPHKAQRWAVEHSKITHGHPLALAACAAMATGVAHALSGSKKNVVTEHMIKAAQSYHLPTADKMRKALSYAQHAKELIRKASPCDPFAETSHPFDRTVLLKNPFYKAFHGKVFAEFAGWAADDAIAGALYIFELFSHDFESAVYLSVHTPGDSDSIAAMSGALIGAFTHKPLPISDTLEDEKLLEACAQEFFNLSAPHQQE